MIRISNDSLNGITLGKKRNEIPKSILNNSEYFFEFDQDDKSSLEAKLVTISVVDEKEFNLNERVMNFDKINLFIEEKDPFVELSGGNYFYTFPEYNLSVG